MPVVVDGEPLRVPNRVYFEASAIRDLWDSLDGVALTAALCLGTRSCDGYLRERCLRRLIGHSEHWVVPYVLALTGEYVLEIVQLVVDAWPSFDQHAYAAFARDNPAFIALMRQRVLSYWDCYYRWTMPLDEYPGMRLLRMLDTAASGAEA